MVKFRKMHEELRTVVGTALSSDPAAAGSALTAINQAYTNIKDVDVLDKIRELLTAAKDDANEMFRVCAKFNPLFVREKIKNAIREYQEQLIATVNKDINVLRTKLNNKFSKSEARRMSQLRDLPKVPGEIIWMRQIERQLLTYIRRYVAHSNTLHRHIISVSHL
jgi:dynein heavy chain 1